jgi:hypothetical protein
MSREACYWAGVGIGSVTTWAITYLYCYLREKERHRKHVEARKRIAKYSQWR